MSQRHRVRVEASPSAYSYSDEDDSVDESGGEAGPSEMGTTREYDVEADMDDEQLDDAKISLHGMHDRIVVGNISSISSAPRSRLLGGQAADDDEAQQELSEAPHRPSVRNHGKLPPMAASRASLKPATESTNSITESADDASVNRVRSEDSGGEFHDRQKQFKRQSSSNSSTNDTIAPVTRREEFDEGSDAEDGEKEEVLGQRGKRDLGAVVPSVASIEAAEVISLQKSKPKLEQKKSTKGVHRGEQLTSEAAVQFMILERQALDEEFAAMRRENEKLRRELQMHQAEPSAFVSRPTSAALAGRSPDGATSAALMKKYQDDAEKLRRENEDLNRKKQEMERLLEEQRRVAALAKSQRIESVMDSASARSQRPQSSSAEPSKPKPPMQRSASMGQPDGAIDLPTTDRQYSALPVILWEGGKLWKVPYNGRGMPEERMVMIKKAQRPGVGARPVRVLANGVDSRAYGSAAAPVAYIQYPPTIIWFGADKPQDEKFARELLLTSGTYLVEGHQTPAFWKMLTRGAPMPPKELCFSIVTSTRTLDLAAETLREANAWKNAIHTLLVILTTNKEWAINSLHRSEPTWHHDAMVEPTKANSRKAAPPVIDSQAAVEKPNKSGSMKEQMFTATRLNNFSALDDLLRSGVPVNLMDSKTSDTPLMMACRLNFPVIAKLCLDYGAKNDPHPDFGQTALHAAVSSKAFECCEVLMEASAPSKADAIICNLPDSMGLTPLHLAALLGHVKILELLIQHGGDISRRDGRGWTALHCCVSKGHESALALMMDCGGDDMIELIDKEGNTPLHTAAEEGHLECARLLLETAANPDLMNAQGFTPFAIANARGHNKLGSLILAYIDGSSGFGFGHSRKPNIREQRTPSKTPARTPGGTVMGRLVDSPLAMQRGQEMLQHSNQRDHRNQLYGYSYHPTISTEPVHQYNVHGNYESPVKSMGLPRPHTTPVVSSPTPFAQQPASRTSQAVELDPVSQMNLNSDYRVISRAGQRNSNTSDAGTPSKSNNSGNRTKPSMFQGLQINDASSEIPGVTSHHTREQVQSWNVVQQSYEGVYNDVNQYENEAGFHHQTEPAFASSLSPTRLTHGAESSSGGKYYDPNAQYFASPLEEFEVLGARWQVFNTEEGYTYYLDSASGHSQWEDPRTHGWKVFGEPDQSVSTISSTVVSQSPNKKFPSPAPVTTVPAVFNQPKNAPGKTKPQERQRHIRAAKRAPMKIEVDDSTSPEYDFPRRRQLQSQFKYTPDEASDTSMDEIQLSRVKEPAKRGSKNKNRFIAPSNHARPMKTIDERDAFVSEFVRRHLSDDEDEEGDESDGDHEKVGDSEGSRELELDEGIFAGEEVTLHLPLHAKESLGVLNIKTSPSAQEMKNIDTYWKNASNSPQKMTPRTKAQMAMEKDELFERFAAMSEGVSASPIARPDREDAGDVDRGLLEHEKQLRSVAKSLNGKFEEEKSWDVKPQTESDWDDDELNKSHRQGDASDWDEGMDQRMAESRTKVVNARRVNIGESLAVDPAALSRDRSFDPSAPGYGNGGNVFNI